MGEKKRRSEKGVVGLTKRRKGDLLRKETDKEVGRVGERVTGKV